MRKSLVLMACLIACQAAMAENWETALKAAQVKATKDGTDVLVVLGKDNRLKELLSNAEFQASAAKTHVLTALSTDDEISSLQAQTGQITDPSLILMDSSGHIYGVVEGYFDTKPDQYTQALATFIAIRDDMNLSFAAADKLEGVQRAVIVHEALLKLIQAGLFQNGSYFGYDALVKEIKLIDKNNENKIKSKWDFYDMLFAARDQMNVGKIGEAVKLLDGFIAQYKATDAANAQTTAFLKANVFYSQKDMENMKGALKEGIAIDPTTKSAKSAQAFLDKQAKQEAQKEPTK